MAPKNASAHHFTAGACVVIPDQGSFNSDMAGRLFKRMGLILPRGKHLCPHGCSKCHAAGECHLCYKRHPDVWQENQVRYSAFLGHLGAVQELVANGNFHESAAVIHTDGSGRVPIDQRMLEFSASIRRLEHILQRPLNPEFIERLRGPMDPSSFANLLGEVNVADVLVDPGRLNSVPTEDNANGRRVVVHGIHYFGRPDQAPDVLAQSDTILWANGVDAGGVQMAFGLTWGYEGQLPPLPPSNTNRYIQVQSPH